MDIYFNIDRNTVCNGLYLYRKYKMVLIEAEGIVMSGNYYNYDNFRKRVILNYAVGFMKQEIEKEKLECLKKQYRK